MHINKKSFLKQTTYLEVPVGKVFILNDRVFIKTTESIVDLETGEVIDEPHKTLYVKLYSNASVELGDEG